MTKQLLIVEVKEKNVYGRTLYAPINGIAKLIVEMMGAKTFSQVQLDALRNTTKTITDVEKKYGLDRLILDDIELEVIIRR